MRECTFEIIIHAPASWQSGVIEVAPVCLLYDFSANFPFWRRNKAVFFFMTARVAGACLCVKQNVHRQTTERLDRNRTRLLIWTSSWLMQKHNVLTLKWKTGNRSCQLYTPMFLSAQNGRWSQQWRDFGLSNSVTNIKNLVQTKAKFQSTH